MDLNADFKDRRLSTRIYFKQDFLMPTKRIMTRLLELQIQIRIVQFIHKQEYLNAFYELMTGTQKGKRVL